MTKCLALFLTAITLFWLKASSQPLPDLRPYATIEKKLSRLNTYCDSLLTASNTDAVKTVAEYAVSITPKNDYYNLSLFNCFIGNALEGTTATDSVCVNQYSVALQYANKSGNIQLITDAAGRMMTLLGSSPANKGRRAYLATLFKTLADTTINQRAKSNLMGYLSGYYANKEQKDSTIYYAINAVDIAKKSFKKGEVEPEFVATALYRLATSFRNMQQPEKQIPYLLEMRSYTQQNTDLLAYYYLTIGVDYLSNKNPTQAKLFYDSLYSIAKNSKTNTLLWNNVIEADLSFAQFYTIHTTDYNKALFYAQNAVEISRTWGFGYFEASINYTLGSVYLAKKEFANALPLLQNGTRLAKGRYGVLYTSCLRNLAKAYGGTGNWQLAYKYSDTLAAVTDSLNKINTDKGFADAEARYQNKEKQQEIELNKVQLAAAKQQKIWLAAGAALLAIVVVLLFIIYRNKKNTADTLAEKNTTLNQLNNALEQANQTKARLFSIIGHDLRSPINQVYQFLKLQQLNPGRLSEAQRNELSEKIQTATGSLLETMEDLLLWSKTQMTQFAADIQLFFVHPVIAQATSLLQLNSEAKQITVVNNLPENIKAAADPYFLQAIVRNLLQNAIKASTVNATVTINSQVNNGHVLISIHNNGPAFTQQQYEYLLSQEETGKSFSGLGLRLVNELSLKMGAKINFTSPPEGGTTATIKLQSNLHADAV